jgi:hypothetical protein
MGQTWRRRQFRLIGARLVAYNTITKGPVAVIDFGRAEFLEDSQDGLSSSRNSPVLERTGATTDRNASRRTLSMDDDKEPYRVERSFKVIFEDGDEISFFADSDEEKAEWMDEFREMIGNVPPRFPWAEVAIKARDAGLGSGSSKRAASKTMAVAVAATTTTTTTAGPQPQPRASHETASGRSKMNAVV